MTDDLEKLDNDPELGETANEAKVEKGRRKDKLRGAQWKRDLVIVMGTPEGRRVFAEVFRLCEDDKIAFMGTERHTNFVLGQQSVGNALKNSMKKHCLHLLRRMEDEERKDVRDSD